MAGEPIVSRPFPLNPSFHIPFMYYAVEQVFRVLSVIRFFSPLLQALSNDALISRGLSTN